MSGKSENALAFGIGTLAGVLAGVAAAILFTPKSGEEMRKDLKAAAEKITENPANVVYTNKINSDALVRLQYTIESQFNKIINALKAGRMAAAKIKEESECDCSY